MQALLLTDRLTFTTDYPNPTPAPGEAILRVIRAGICRTDLELLKGYMGFHGVPGHEFVGVLEQFDTSYGVVPGVHPGDRVVSEINCVTADSPSHDYAARAQDPNRTTLGIAGRDGVFAEYTRVPLANLHRVPDSVTDDEAAFVEPLAAACQVLEQVHVRTSDRVAVLGDGKLGLLCAQVMALTGCETVAIGKHQEKLDILCQRGLRTMLVSEWDGRNSYDVVVECTGSAGGFDQARRMLHPRGTLVLKSTFEGLTSANLTAVVVDEINVVGSRCGPFATALRLLAQKRVDVMSLVQARYSLKDGLLAFKHAQSQGILKVLIDMNQS